MNKLEQSWQFPYLEKRCYNSTRKDDVESYLYIWSAHYMETYTWLAKALARWHKL